jgi:hypothetical protein
MSVCTNNYHWPSLSRRQEKLTCSPMVHSYKQLADQALDFWLARGAVLVIVVLQIAIVNDLMIGPRWLAPTIELALLIPLSIATAWTQRRARKASTDEQWTLVGRRDASDRCLHSESRPF